MKVQTISYVHPILKIVQKGCIVIPKGPIKAIVQICHDRYDHITRYKSIMMKLSEIGCAVIGFDLIVHEQSIETINYPPQMMVETLHDDFLAGCDALQNPIQEATNLGIRIPHILIGFGFGALLSRLYVMKYEDISALVLCGDEGFMSHNTLLKKCRHLQRKHSPADVTTLNYAIREGYNKYFSKDDDSRFAWRVGDPSVQHTLEKERYAIKDYPISTLSNMLTLYKSIELKGWLEACPDELPIFIMSGYLDPCSRFTRNLDVMLKEMQRSSLSNCFYRYYPNSRHEVLFDLDKTEARNDLYHFIRAIQHQFIC